MKKIEKFLPNFLPYFLLIPTIVIMTFFVFYPFIESFIYSLCSLNLKKPGNIYFTGFRNYFDIFLNKSFLKALLNTIFIFTEGMFLTTTISLCLALSLQNPFRGRTFIFVVMLIPWALPPVVNGIIWGWIFDPSYGLLNGILYKLNLISEYKIWMANSFQALNWITLVFVWRMTPLATLIFLGALQTIPNEIYDAARIDGAGKWKCFRYIILSFLKPSLAIVFTLTTIATVNIFDEIIILTGYRWDTRSLSMETYVTAFRFLDFGHGSAIAYFMVIISLLAGFFYVSRLYRGEIMV